MLVVKLAEALRRGDLLVTTDDKLWGAVVAAKPVDDKWISLQVRMLPSGHRQFWHFLHDHPFRTQAAS